MLGGAGKGNSVTPGGAQNLGGGWEERSRRFLKPTFKKITGFPAKKKLVNRHKNLKNGTEESKT